MYQVVIHTWAAQLSQPPHALQYEEALRAAGVTSLDPVLKEMATGDRPALEAEDFTTLGKTRVMILDVDRQQLLKCGPTSYNCDI